MSQQENIQRRNGGSAQPSGRKIVQHDRRKSDGNRGEMAEMNGQKTTAIRPFDQVRQRPGQEKVIRAHAGHWNEQRERRVEKGPMGKSLCPEDALCEYL